MTYEEILSVINRQSAPLRRNIMNIIENKIKESFPKWNFEIINFDDKTKKLEIKCLECGLKKEYKKYYDLIYKKNPCICNSNSSQYKSIQYKKELEEYFKETKDFTFIEWTELIQDKARPGVKIKCNNCNQFFEKRISSFIKNKKCPYCVSKGSPNTLSISKRLEDKGYTLLSEYISQDKKVLIRHNECGFIWKVKPSNFSNFLNYNSCPQCNRRISKGEKIIRDYLIKHNICFDREISFNWQSNKLFRYDFYLPAYNLIIEFNGRQHYEETNIFTNSLADNILHDKIKIEEAIKNGFYFLVIPFTQINNIENILNKWFNDYPNGVNDKLTVIERNATFKGENIV